MASVAAPIDDTAAHAPLLRDLGQYLTPLAETSAPPAVGRRRAVGPPNALAKQQALAAAAAVKISVAADGWYRVTRDDLLAAGLDPATDPRRLHLYAEVNEVAMTVEGESQNRIDAIRFYGTALDTVSTNTRVYWLAAADGATRRIQTATATGGTPAPASFLVNAERRDKSVFFAALLNGESESFFGPVITDDAMRPATQMLRLNHIDRAAATADIKIALQGGTEAGADPAHDVAITLNGQPLDDIHFNGRDAVTVHRIVPAGFLVEGDNTLTFVAKNGDGDVSVISSAGISYAHTYDFDSATLVMTVAGGSAVAVRGAPANQVYALDVTDPAAPIELAVTVVDGVARFTTPAEAVRTIVATPTFARPLRVEANQPSSLHATAGADMIIVTHRSLLPAIEPLRQLRASQGLSVLVATIDGIYDEYGYGEKSPAALRAFLSASRRWSNAPRYVLLAGDATFDPRNYLGFGDLDLVPTKLIVTREMKTASDSWLTDFDDDGAADIAIGRLPARTLADARIEIGKIIAYENAPAGQPWEKAAVFVSDGDATLGFDRLTASARDLVPAGYAIQSIDLALSGASAARQSLLASLDQGALLVNFVGHGSVDIWTDSGLFGGEDAKSLHNGERLPFVIAMTCLNGYFHDVYTTSLAEALLAAPGGGAVGVFASSSLTDPHAQAATNQEVVRALLADHATAGEAAMAAQRKATDSDVRRTFLLLGDPSMRLK